MKIENIRINNFKSIYGEQSFDFTTLNGLVKLSGVIGSGKTTIGEAIIYGLFGAVKDHNNRNLISWNCRDCEVEINLISHNKKVNILRNISKPLLITIDGKKLIASNKRDTQAILEEEIFDVPKLAIEKLCVISFNAFNSLASMNPGQTKQFLDDIFGFKLFSDYNEEIVNERRDQVAENARLNTLLTEAKNQIYHLQNKKEEQKKELSQQIDIASNDARKLELNNLILGLKNDLLEKQKLYNDKYAEFSASIAEKKLLGKQAKEYYNNFKSGKCPLCGHDVDIQSVDEKKTEMEQYAKEIFEIQDKQKVLTQRFNNIKSEINDKINTYNAEIRELDNKRYAYEKSVKVLSENYDDLIKGHEQKRDELELKLKDSDKNIGEWNEMNELFTKTLRYSLLDTLIPHINKSIKYYIGKLDQAYTVEYDQEFKAHIYTDGYDREISYSDLSTGQKKSLDMAIIFGIIQNVIANVDFNIFFLDELFSNLDSDSRNVMLSLLKDTLSEGRTIFVVNHAEMNDDFFSHKIRVNLENKKIINKKKQECYVKSSKYNFIF